MFRVKCNQCGAETIALGDPFGTDPPGCHCCPEDHNHDEAANACPGDHKGDCGLGVDGCTVCRPLTITFLGGAPASAGTGA